MRSPPPSVRPPSCSRTVTACVSTPVTRWPDGTPPSAICLPNLSAGYLTRAATPQLTAEDGSFVTYGFAPGPLSIEVSRDDYDAARVDTSVGANGETVVLMLIASPAAACPCCKTRGCVSATTATGTACRPRGGNFTASTQPAGGEPAICHCESAQSAPMLWAPSTFRLAPVT